MTSESLYEQMCKEELGILENLAIKTSILKNEINRLKLEKKANVPVMVEQSSETNFSCEKGDDDSFEDEVLFFLIHYRELSDSFTDDDIKSILPRRKHPKYTEILLRLSMESLKEIKEIKELERDENISSDDKVLCEKVIETEKRKIYFIKSKLIKSEIVEVEENEEKNRIVLVPTISGNIRLIDEIEHIPNDYYDGFKELIESIEDGTFKNVKMFKNHNYLVGISEVKQFKIRVVFTRISTNTYALITAFIKKSDNDKLYKESLISKVRDYYLVEKDLKANLDNPTFIEENNKNVKKLWDVLLEKEDTKVKKREI